MNEQFFALPQEKQQRIVNAAMEVFAINEYKRASTDDIASKAGISKGLLFYYFHNKRALYTYVVDTLLQHTYSAVADEKFSAITDFFEILEYAAQRKMELIASMPYVMDLAMRVYYTDDAAAGSNAQFRAMGHGNKIYATYFKNTDFSKFKEGVDPAQVLRMLTWMADGYIHEKRSQREALCVEELMDEFRTWSAMFRKTVYRTDFK